jgi:class 3 adenylate cyclase/tetratricopeptide (TPR) repeat protein
VSQICLSCGTDNPDGARFCFSCGTPFRADAQPRLERKFATALFADIVGSTALAEREDPEVVRSLIARAFATLAPIIEQHGGTLEAYAGDAILAVFGIPVAHEDDAERAVRASLQMQSAIGELKRTLAAEGRSDLGMRIGVEAGEIVTDLARVMGPRDRMVIGDAVNTAARLQSAAVPGSVVVGPAVHEATKDAFIYESLEALTLKGKSEPVPAWVATMGQSDRARGRVSLGFAARLVGRDEEIGFLTDTFQRVRTQRRPALVTVLGTPGVGKSRLVAEFIRSLDGAGGSCRVAQGRCLSYGNVPYSALADAVKVLCGIHENDPPEVVAEKTATALDSLVGDRSLAPRVEALLATVPGPAAAREQLFEAWRTFLEKLAARAPLVLVLEDIHWADDGLLDFVHHLTDWARGPLLIVTLARPDLLERRPTWGAGTANHEAINLDPLTPDECRSMVEDLLSTDLPDHLIRFVVDRSEGNPLFGEEIVRVLIDRGAIEHVDGGWKETMMALEIAVPRSIHAVIASRIDALAEDEKSFVQDAAVVGREFWLGAVEQLSRRDRATALATVDRLRAKDVIAPRESTTFSGELEFAFRHVLIRDVAYESLPKSFRADKHVTVARWAEAQAAERREEIAELLATHFSEAVRYLHELGESVVRDLEREMFRWVRTAGERALRLWQHREAARWFRLAVDAAERVGFAPEERAGVWESYARAAEGVEPYAAIAAAFERALELYLSLGRVSDAGRVEAWLAHVASQFGDDEGVLRWARSALERLEPLGESPDLALALIHLGWQHHRHRRDDEAEPLLRQALAIAERVEDPAIYARAMLSLGMLVFKSGRTDEGMKLLDLGLDRARASGDLPLLLWGFLVTSEGLQIVASDYRRAEDLVREGLELALKAGHVEQAAWMQGNLSDYLVDQGRLDEAEEPARAGLEAARAIGEVPRIGYSLLMNAYLRVLRLDLDEAEGLLVELRGIVEQGAESYHEGWADVIEALIARARGDEAKATAVLVAGAARSGRRLEPWGGQLLLLECVRSLAHAGRVADAAPFRELLAGMARTSGAAAAFLAWADGTLEREPAAARALIANAVERFEALGRRVEHGRCQIDLADAERELGHDPGPSLVAAREILGGCGAALFLRDVDEVERRQLASS